MNHSIIDFNKISEVLTNTMEVIKDEQEIPTTAIEQLKNAQYELQQAMSFSFSSIHK